jgi:glycosyltransferase involved in cell wall biosynthesis
MISAVVLTKNEEKNIIDCLESLSFCDERIIVDDFSNDLTLELAKKSGATVYQRKLEGDFSKQRNFGLEKAKGDWILFIDADERVSNELKNEIIYKTAKRVTVEGYYIRRFDFMNGKMLEHGETAHISLLRLAKKGKGIWKGKVHETWNISSQTQVLDSALFHYPHQTINDFLAEINFYSDLRSKELFEKGVKVAWYDLIFYPKAKFIQNYIFRSGFKDGTEGMIMALMMSFHSFLVRGKLWQLWDGKTKK